MKSKVGEEECTVLPTCQPYSQEDTIGYLYFFSGIRRFRSLRYRVRPWPSWEMPWKSSFRVAGVGCLISKSSGLPWAAEYRGNPLGCLTLSPWTPPVLNSWSWTPLVSGHLACTSFLTGKPVAGTGPAFQTDPQGACQACFLVLDPSFRYL